MTIIVPGWGGDPYNNKLPSQDVRPSATNNPDKVPPKPNLAADLTDRFTSRDPKTKPNGNSGDFVAGGWTIFAAAETAKPAKSDALPSQLTQPIASKQEEQLVTAALMNYKGPDAWRLLGISGNFA